MFSRIRYVAHVLSSSKPDPFGQPDIVFEEERSDSTSEISRYISRVLSIGTIAITFGFLAALLLKVLPIVSSQHATVITGALAVLLAQLWHHISQSIQDRIHKTLRIDEIIAPYFGHKIMYAIRTLRG